MRTRTKVVLALLLVVILVVILVVTGLAASVREPEVTLVNIDAMAYDSSNDVSVRLTFVVNNQNVIGGVLKKVEVDVCVNGNFVGYIDDSPDEDIPPMNSATIELTYHAVTTTTQLQKYSWSLTNLLFEVGGMVTVNVFGKDIYLNVDKEERLSVDE